MKNKEIKEKMKVLKKLYNEEKFDDAHSQSESFVLDLFKEKKYSDIVEADKKLESVPIIFEVAYAYNEIGDLNKAEEIYEYILSSPGEENNAAILNNLSNIKKENKDINKAYELIRKAFKIDCKDEIIKRNYENISRIIQEKDEKKLLFKNAGENLKKETEWALEKLHNFLISVKKEKDFKDDKIPIPKWKFKVLIGTDDKKAESLRGQWVEKGYIRITNEKGNYSEMIYEINPYLAKFLKKATPPQLNKEWFRGIDNINVENLEKIKYFEIFSNIQKINKKYKKLITRDFDELVFNYLLKNRKTVIVLSGSFVELLFTYYCEKKNIKQIEYNLRTKKVKRDLYECTLSDFLNYFQEQKSFKSIVIHIGNLTRIYRNFIHPGNEIRIKESLDDSKVEICFHSTLEITQILLK